MAKKHKSYPGEPTLDMGFDEMDAVSQQETGPVTVLGMTFSNDEERRAYFREQLRAKLPELRNIEGFPIGSDDDIVNLSDPPYYTACPNPWLNDFIAEWEQEKLQLEAEGKRHPNVVVNEPYAADVSEGKRNPIYDVHSYHTKVPHPAIMRYLLHYTQPGDNVLDGFCGSGMTGVAATMCNNEQAVKSLGYNESNVGIRHAILSDLSPFASLLSSFMNRKKSVGRLINEAKSIIEKVESELGWMYQTEIDGKKYEIQSIIWSEIFSCPHCGNEITFYNVAYDAESDSIKDSLSCPYCSSKFVKRDLHKLNDTSFDVITGEISSERKFAPVAVKYKIGRNTHYKTISDSDIEIIKHSDSLPIDAWIPTHEVWKGVKTQEAINHGIKYVHQFYTHRNLLVLSRIYQLIGDNQDLKTWFTSQLVNVSKLNRYRPGVSFPYNPMNGTFYISSLVCEANVIEAYRNKLNKIESAAQLLNQTNLVSISSATKLNVSDNSIDYIFVDPPFGANIMYSDLNIIWESWLNLATNTDKEAIVNAIQSKSLFDYQILMQESFREFYRVLKPGKWMTVEFSNTSASVWNSIQTALQQMGFVVAAVSALDKQQGSYNAVTSTTAVKQDLIISCFKPTEQLLYKFENDSPEANVWDFVDELLSHLSVHIEHGNKTTTVVERSPKILYDRLISFYVQHGFPVPLNAQEFQVGLRERYAERDGMYFTASQAAKYDELRKRTDGFQASLFFVDSEQGGIAWLNNELSTPQTYQDLQPKWMQAINGVRKGDILPELMQILEENFIKESDGKWRKPNLQDDVDLSALRHKALMREFKVYVEVAQKPRGKIKEARVEALRAGFKQCYQDKDFATIVAVGDRIPQNLLTEDEQLLQFYEIASSRV